MDVRITGGDIAILSDGDYASISGLDEAVQRVCMTMLTERGSFPYDRSLGVDYGAFGEDYDAPAARLDMLLKEAIADVGGVEAEVLSFTEASSIARIKVTYHGSSAVTEVDISGLI